MKTYVVNLEHRKDRIADLKVPVEISGGSYEIFPATDGSIFSFEKNRRLRGHMGCWDSHKRLMERIKDENNEMTLVLEDDCYFIPERVELIWKCMKELSEDWDLLYLGGINQDMPEKYSENLDLAKNILQTHAYIIRDKFIPTMLEILSNHRWKADLVFSEAIKRGKCFISNPPIAIQSESKSDINPSHSNNHMEEKVQIIEIWQTTDGKDAEVQFDTGKGIKRVAIIANGLPIKLSPDFIMETKFINKEELDIWKKNQ